MADHDLSPAIAAALATEPGDAIALPATPESCYWGYLDAAEPATLTVPSGTVIDIEAVTHHSGDAPDLMMDEACGRSGTPSTPPTARRACTS